MLESYRIDLLFESEPDLTNLGEIASTALLERAQLQPTQGSAVRLVERLDNAPPPLPEWHLGPLGAAQPGEIAPSLEQSWWWPEAREAAARARFALPVFDRHNQTTDFKRRLAHCQRLAHALIDALSPLAVEWIPSQQLLEPGQLARALEEDGFGAPLPGGLNVRFFRLEYDEPAGDPEFLMDTVGLAALGLADLQCHFRGLDPEEVSRTLYETGCYMYDAGYVMADGDTVQGPRTDDRWRCTHAPALAEPERGVVDLDPGFPFAAGHGV